MSAIAYKRLPGKRRGFFSKSSVWLGPDHILLVEGSRVTEQYRRVYFRDVQAMLIVKKRRVVIQAQMILIPLALLIAVFRLPADWRATGTLAAWLILAGAALYLYIAASFYSCGLYLATAVGNAWVPSVFRVWQARSFSRRVRPLIAEAQGDGSQRSASGILT